MTVPRYVELEATLQRPPGAKPSRVPGMPKPRHRVSVAGRIDPDQAAGYRLADGAYQPPLFTEAA